LSRHEFSEESDFANEDIMWAIHAASYDSGKKRAETPNPETATVGVAGHLTDLRHSNSCRC